MANLVTKTTYGKNPKQILIGQDSYYIALSAIIKGTAGQTMYAGQPLAGDIKKRDTGFTAAETAAVGILLHDVTFDADGKANGTIVLAGCVDLLKDCYESYKNLLKLEKTVQTALSTATGLDRIIFVEGSAI